MQSKYRVILDMAGRAVGFGVDHTDDNPATAPVIVRLSDLYKQASDIVLQLRSGQAALASAVDDKERLRIAIENGLIALFGVAKAASVDNRTIAFHRRPPGPHANEIDLVTTARVSLAEATAQKEKLAPYGFDDDMLHSLAADVEAFSAALARQRKARADQAGAFADLKVVSKGIISAVKNLDAVYRVRFKHHPDLMAAWKSARNVAWRSPDSATPVTPITPTPPAPDQAGAA